MNFTAFFGTNKAPGEIQAGCEEILYFQKSDQALKWAAKAVGEIAKEPLDVVLRDMV